MRRIKIRRDTHGGTKYISASGWPEEMQEFHEIEEQYLFPIVARIVTHLSKPFILFSTTTHSEHILNPKTFLQVKQNYSGWPW